MALAIRLKLVLVFGLLWFVSPSIMAQEKIEVVLLIDVSGSMKKNDPQNLRIPATNLLIHLLKNRATLTIFTFADQSKLLQETKEVNALYEKNFSKKQKQINSSGKHTNILSALDAANKTWSDNKSRFIVLLTDGKIDRGSLAQDVEDKKIINEKIIPELKKNNIRVYSIGLGAGVDNDLLHLFADQSNGIYQFIHSSEEAEKSLYNVFTSIVPAQGLPLEKETLVQRQIKVDPSITQLSIILEKKNAASQIVLEKPDTTPYQFKQHDFSQFILIDINKPDPGIWTLKGKQHKVERAIVLSELELVSTPLSGEYYHGELITFSATLKSKQHVVLPPNTEVTLNLKNKSSTYSELIPLTNDSMFQKELVLNLQPGLSKGILLARNNLFSRENQFLFTVLPAPFQQSQDNEHLKIELLDSRIEPDSVHINLRAPQHTYPLVPINGQWQIKIVDLCAEEQGPEFTLNTEIQAKTPAGRAISLIMPETQIVCPIVPKTQVSTVLPITTPQAKEPLTATSTQNQWMSKVYLSSFVFFMFLMVLGGFFYQKTQKAYQKKLEELNNDVSEEIE